jgi:hypothetical protein
LLSCHWRIERLKAEDLQGLEVSVLWYTEGKGDEDLTVHFFHRWSAVRLRELEVSKPQLFETRLPESPLSYNGHLLRIRWCVRMRLYLGAAAEMPAEMVTEQPLTVVSRLGSLPVAST